MVGSKYQQNDKTREVFEYQMKYHGFEDKSKVDHKYVK